MTAIDKIHASGPAPDLSLEVGQRLRARRKLQGLTLLQLARMIGTTPQTVQRLETANMRMGAEWIEKFCRVLDVDAGMLFGRPSENAQLREIIRDMRREAEVLQLRARQFLGDIDVFMNKCSVVEEACREVAAGPDRTRS